MTKIILQRNSQPGVPGAVVPLLDAYPAFRAYSIRKVRTGYTGPLIRVRRSSDNTELDIGSSGYNLNTAALLAFAGSGSAFVKVWYDQSLNEVNVAQNTNAAQPRIVNAGTLEDGLWFDGTDDIMSSATVGLYAAGASTVAAVFNGPTWVGSASTGSATGVLYGEQNGAGANGRYFPLARASAASSDFTRAASYQVSDGGTAVLSIYKQTMFDGTNHQMTALDTGSVATIRGDGGSPAPTTYTRPSITPTVATIGGRLHTPTSNAFLQAHVHEVLVWPTAKAIADVRVIEANQKAKFGTP